MNGLFYKRKFTYLHPYCCSISANLVYHCVVVIEYIHS